jgi:hypothetical protein
VGRSDLVEEVRRLPSASALALNRVIATFTDHQLEPAVRELSEFIDLEGDRFEVALSALCNSARTCPKGSAMQ